MNKDFTIPLNIENKITELKNLINSMTSDYEFEIYGSYAYGLNMAWSDIDIVLIINEFPLSASTAL